MSTKSAITLRDLAFEWPDGTIALDSVNGTFSAGRTGLIGRNGAGKSTLLRLIAGELQPTSGHIDTGGEVGYLPQTLTLRRDTTIGELLGIQSILDAMKAIESGDVDQRHFDAIGDDWDIESRADEALHQIGFSAADLCAARSARRRRRLAGRPASHQREHQHRRQRLHQPRTRGRHHPPRPPDGRGLAERRGAAPRDSARMARCGGRRCTRPVAPPAQRAGNANALPALSLCRNPCRRLRDRHEGFYKDQRLPTTRQAINVSIVALLIHLPVVWWHDR